MMLASGDKSRAPVIQGRDDLVAHIEQGAKPKPEWRIGTEHEKIPFHRDGLRPVPYEGPAGISALLCGLAERFGWRPVYDNDKVIALEEPSSDLGGSITLEPGGQFELSGAPLKTVFQTCDEVNRHLRQVGEIADPLGMSFLALGYSPLWTLAETPHMPKSRYAIMTDYMPKVGKLGLDMMYRTATVQVNLDFADEADMVKKLRVSLALQPIATALFANSPFTEGKPNGYLSYRSAIWLDTDNARAGMLPFAFEDGMGFERYVDYVLPGRQTAAVAGRETDHRGLGRSSDDDLPRGAAQALPRDARRGQRALAQPLRLAGALGRASLRSIEPRRRLRSRQGLDGGGAPAASQRRSPACPADALP